MKKMTVVLGLVAMMSVSAFGVGFIGTPTAELEKSQWNVGFNYTYISMDLAKIKYSESSQEFDPAGNPDGDPETDSYKEEINDNNVQRYYGTIGYGVTDVWEAYVQLGIADVKAQTKEEGEESEGHNFDNDFAWGWGTRYTFYEQDNIRWGASLQMNWLDTSVGHKGTWVDGGLDGTWNATIDIIFSFASGSAGIIAIATAFKTIFTIIYVYTIVKFLGEIVKSLPFFGG